VGFHPAPFFPDPGVWIAALLTLFIFSFLYKDNPFYKFAEHLFVGVSAGYFVVQQFWQVIVPNLIDPVMDPAKPHRWTYFVAVLLCLMLFTRLFAKASWLSRFAIAVIIGVYAGAKTTGFAQAEVVAQVQATMLPLWDSANIVGSINNIVLVIGVVCTLVFFFFSTEHKGAIGATANIRPMNSSYTLRLNVASL